MESVPYAWHDSTELRYFMAVAESGSLSAASQRLFVAVSAISRQIQQLEEHIGVALFERHARGMHLTDAGHLLRQHELRKHQELQYVIAGMHGLHKSHETKIRIAISEGVAFILLPRLMNQFRKKHPGTLFHVDVLGADEIPSHIIRHDYDVGLQFSLDKRQDANVVGSFEAPIVALMKENHPLANQDIHLKDLQDWPMIVPDEDSTIRQLFAISLRMHNLYIEPTVTCRSFATQFTTVKTFPDAIGLCSQQTLIGTDQNDGLIMKKVEGLDLQRRVFHIRANNDWKQRPLIKEFVEYAYEEIKQIS